MAETINMPKLGFDMAEGLLVRWVKQVGENINKGDVLAEIETDKATVEVESSASGVVLSHIVDQGTIVPVNAPIAVVGAEGEKVDAPVAEGGKQKAEAKAEEKPAAPSQPTPASTSQVSAPAETASAVSHQQVLSKPVRLRRRSRKTTTLTLPMCRALDLVVVLFEKMWNLPLQAERPSTFDLQLPPRQLPRTNYQSLWKTRSFLQQNSARQLAGGWLNQKPPSRTSTSPTNSKWTR